MLEHDTLSILTILHGIIIYKGLNMDLPNDAFTPAGWLKQSWREKLREAGLKWCPKCKTVQSLSNFKVNAQGHHRSWCQSCVRDRAYQQFESTPPPRVTDEDLSKADEVAEKLLTARYAQTKPRLGYDYCKTCKTHKRPFDMITRNMCIDCYKELFDG